MRTKMAVNAELELIRALLDPTLTVEEAQAVIREAFRISSPIAKRAKAPKPQSKPELRAGHKSGR
jgi:hypothetical protein